jgi:hypothetical protein
MIHVYFFPIFTRGVLSSSEFLPCILEVLWSRMLQPHNVRFLEHVGISYLSCNAVGFQYMLCRWNKVLNNVGCTARALLTQLGMPAVKGENRRASNLTTVLACLNSLIQRLRDIVAFNTARTDYWLKFHTCQFSCNSKSDISLLSYLGGDRNWFEDSHLTQICKVSIFLASNALSPTSSTLITLHPELTRSHIDDWSGTCIPSIASLCQRPR